MLKTFYAILLIVVVAFSVSATGCQSTGGSYHGSDGHAGHSH